jgi:2-polyprenyl-6-methoxyphenol hydroxylase-like FAD-dependent oxidoreductase
MATAGNILIVGAGLAGLTLAAALEQRGIQAEVVERNTGWRADGAGLLVHANGMRVLAGLGIATAVTDAGIVVRRWAFTDQQAAGTHPQSRPTRTRRCHLPAALRAARRKPITA